MPFAGPETVVGPPPLVAPPTGLLQSVTVVEHALLQTEGNLEHLVGPDAPDTILASAIESTVREMFDNVNEVGKVVAALDRDQHERLRAEVARRLTAAAMGGMELGGDAGPDPLDHWAAGIRWLPEPHLMPTLFDPCTDASLALPAYGDARVVDDAVTATSTALTSIKAFFTPEDVGKNVIGAGAHAADIAALTTIAAYVNAQHVTLSQATTGTHTGVTVLIQPADTGATRKAPVTGQPFLVTYDDACSTFGWRAADYIGRVTRGLAPRESIAVEAEFMHGGLMGTGGAASGTNRFLSDSNCVAYDTGSVDPKPVQALAYANEVIAKAGIGQGMIHVSAFFAEVAAAAGSPFKVDSRGRLTTLNGNIVVPGNGYDGVGPDGTGGTADDAGHDSGHPHEWIYVTDMPVVWRAPAPNIFPATLREATNRDHNEVTFRAERPYIVEWSALLQTAIKVNVLA